MERAAISGILGGALAACAMKCTWLPRGIHPVSPFDLSRYLGTWFEVARLDHSFERGLEAVSAKYSARHDGGIDVLNRGFDPRRKRWREARGVAYPLYRPGVGSLRVRFAFPIYAAYHIIELDQAHYSVAMVCGASRSYLWILSRTPQLEESVLLLLLRQADQFGFNTGNLIYSDPEVREI